MFRNPRTGSSVSQEVPEREEARPAPASPERREEEQHREEQQAGNERQERRGRRPARIDEAEVHRQQRLVQVEPDRPARARRARGQAVGADHVSRRWRCGTGTRPSPVPAPAPARRTAPPAAGPALQSFPAATTRTEAAPPAASPPRSSPAEPAGTGQEKANSCGLRNSDCGLPSVVLVVPVVVVRARRPQNADTPGCSPGRTPSAGCSCAR